MKWAAVLANLGWVSISSQHILPNAAFLLSSSHVLFLFPTCMRHSISTWFADCIPRLQGHSGESKPRTFLEFRNFPRPIFSVLIWTISELAALQRPLCIFNTFLVGFGQMVRSSSRSSRLTRLSPIAQRCCALVLTWQWRVTCLGLSVLLCSRTSHLSAFTLLYPVASFAAMCASSFPLISLWEGIQWKETGLPWALRVSRCSVVVCICIIDEKATAGLHI